MSKKPTIAEIQRIVDSYFSDPKIEFVWKDVNDKEEEED